MEHNDTPLLPTGRAQSHWRSGCLENKAVEGSGPEWAQKILSQEMVFDQRRWQTEQEQLRRKPASSPFPDDQLLSTGWPGLRRPREVAELASVIY